MKTSLASTDYSSRILAEYKQKELLIDEAHAYIQEAIRKGVIGYFHQGASIVNGHASFSMPTCVESAKLALRVEYWLKVIAEIKLFDLMPASKRIEANNLFSGVNCPQFDESTLLPTLQDLLRKQKDFFIERIDGIFMGLSKTHFTNKPSGFSSKMIIAEVFDESGYVKSSEGALISDLRAVIGRLTGRGEPTEFATKRLIEQVASKHIGKKVDIDGASISIRTYKCGTVHFEVAEEIADQLNSYLAELHHAAIPSDFRPKKKTKRNSQFSMEQRMIPLSVVERIMSLKVDRENRVFSNLELYKNDIEPVREILCQIGAIDVRSSKVHVSANFNYDPKPVFDFLSLTGVCPDVKSHQFYPSTGVVAEDAAELLDIQNDDECCEPSAGNGDLARFLPDDALCIEISPLRCEILKAKGHNTVRSDFITWSNTHKSTLFDKILMNPPFSNGRAKLHVETALEHLRETGRLVAIVPSSMRNNYLLDGFDIKWSDVYSEQFEGTLVQVVIMVATRQKF